MASSNPFLARAEALAKSSRGDLDAGVMTLAGASTKTLILAAVVIGSAAYTWEYVAANPEQSGFLSVVGVSAGFLLALVTIFRPRSAPVTAPLYSVFEGVALGAISALLSTIPKYRGLPVQAVMLTFAVFIGMALLYRARIIQASARLVAIVSAATFGICVYYLLNLVLGLFHTQMPFINSSSPVGIGFSLLICGVAAFNLILDFGQMEALADSQAPKYMEWYAAFGLIVTLVWLYLELLRLLMKRK